jgi:hypothetical protein
MKLSVWLVRSDNERAMRATLTTHCILTHVPYNPSGDIEEAASKTVHSSLPIFG